MMSRIAVGVLLLAGTALAQPSVVIELVPDNPGPYVGGESITVDVWAHSLRSSDTYIWLARLDFADSSDALDLDPTFTFDLSSSATPDNFQRDPNLPIPWTSNLLEIFCPPCRLQLPAGGSLRLGSIGLRLPTGARTYRLDVTNADDQDLDRGIQMHDDGSFFWRASSGDITGGTLDFPVVPLVPTVSQWGLAIMALLMVAIGSAIVVQRGDAGRRPLLASAKARSAVRGTFRAWLAAICATGALTVNEKVGAEPFSMSIEVTQTSLDSGIVAQR